MSERESTGSLIKTYGVAILLAVTVALALRAFVIEAYRIPSATMRPTLEPGDTIFVSKSAYGLRWPWSGERITHGDAPRYGDVVIFSFPLDQTRDYIKRVVGLAGDTVQVRKGHVILNGKDLTESGARGTCGQENAKGYEYAVCWEPPLIDDFGPEKVPAGSVFVIGDYRSEAGIDSRLKQHTWGIVPIELLKAKAKWVWLSVEPRSFGGSAFPKLRFERMFHAIR